MTPFGNPPAFRLAVDVEAPVALDQTTLGPVRLIRIAGGTVTGSLKGQIVRGGSDWQTVTPDGVANIEARYLLELDDGAIIELQSRGQRAPDKANFWTSIWLRTVAPAYQAVNRNQYLGYGNKQAGCVVIDAFLLP
jgi:subtilisin family serine protease